MPECVSMLTVIVHVHDMSYTLSSYIYCWCCYLFHVWLHVLVIATVSPLRIEKVKLVCIWQVITVIALQLSQASRTLTDEIQHLTALSERGGEIEKQLDEALRMYRSEFVDYNTVRPLIKATLKNSFGDIGHFF